MTLRFKMRSVRARRTGTATPKTAGQTGEERINMRTQRAGVAVGAKAETEHTAEVHTRASEPEFSSLYALTNHAHGGQSRQRLHTSLYIRRVDVERIPVTREYTVCFVLTVINDNIEQAWEYVVRCPTELAESMHDRAYAVDYMITEFVDCVLRHFGGATVDPDSVVRARHALMCGLR